MDNEKIEFFGFVKGILGMLLAMLLTFILTAPIEGFTLIGQVLPTFSMLIIVSTFTFFSILTLGFLDESSGLARPNRVFGAVEGLLGKD